MRKYLGIFNYIETWAGIIRIISFLVCVYFAYIIVIPSNELAEWLKIPFMIFLILLCGFLIFPYAHDNFKSGYRKWQNGSPDIIYGRERRR